MGDAETLRGARVARALIGTLAVLLLACASRAAAGFDAGPVDWLLEKWGYNVVLVGSGAASLARGALVRHERAAWLTLGAATLAWAVGNVYYTAVLWDLDPIPVPSVSDVLWLAYYPVTYVGVILLVRARVAKFHASLWVDGILAALAVAALGAASVFERVLAGTGGSTTEVATNLAYPLGDLVLLAVITGGIALTGWKFNVFWAALAASFIAFGVTDSVYLVQNAVGTWQAGSVFEAGWPLATLLLACAAWRSPERLRPRPLDGWRSLLLPLSFALLAFVLLISDHFNRLNLLAVCLAWACGLAVMGRFAMTFVGNFRMLGHSRREALTDSLTGLGNRRRLSCDLDDALADGRPHALVLFDLNGFKSYNDVFGHPAGDALLARLGAQLAAAVQPDGRAYRMGGDEFCVLAPLTERDLPGLIADGADALREMGEGFAISAAHGSVVMPAEAHDAAAALGRADRRMYAQKAGGRRSTEEQSRDVLLKALEEHHPDLGGHVHDVGLLAQAVGRELGLSGRALKHVRQAGELHDIGKIAIPRDILTKPGRLAPEEWVFVQRHTVIGERILGAAPALAAIGPLVRASHERYDGSGYPDGLAGQDIPLGARIVAVCDAYDAMISSRPYRVAREPSQALAELRRCAGSQFDSEVVEAFGRVHEAARVLRPRPDPHEHRVV